jgi:hypothetical protein
VKPRLFCHARFSGGEAISTVEIAEIAAVARRTVG